MAGFFAVLITILSSTSINIGKALQKKGTKSLPKLTFKKDILKTYFENDTWKIGLVLDVLGGVLMILALAIAPVSVVQPVAAGGVAILAGFSHVFLDEKLKEKEWVGVWCAVVGTVGIGWTTGVNTAAAAISEQNGKGEINVSTWRYVLGVFVVLGSTYLCMPSTASGTGSGGMLATAGTGKVGGSNAASSSSSSTMPDATPGTTPQKGSGHGNKNDHFLKSPPTKESMNASMMTTPPKKDKNDKKDKSENASSVSAEFKQQRFRDMLAGARAGALFSLSASSVKLGFQLSRRLAFIWALIGLAASVSLTALGLFSQTKGLKEGNAVVVVCSGNVAQMVTAIPFGILCLGESLPGIGFLFGARGLGVGFFHNVFTFLVWAFSWWLILFGVVIVSGLSTHDVVATIAATGDVRKSVVLPTTMGEAKAMLLSKKEKNKDASRKE
jgi:multidrug transporter EmrE-like cation transporter